MTWLRLLPGVFRLIPREVWYVLALALVYAFARDWHARQVKAHDTTLIAARDHQWQARLDAAHKQALEEKRNGDEARSQLASERRKTHEAMVHDIHVRHDAVRVQLPAEAAAETGCGSEHHSCVSPAASGPEQRTLGGSAASTELPFDGVVVSWNWLTDTGLQCDISTAEARTWRAWYEEMRKNWPTR